MITAQDVREKTFEKSKIGGYDMAEVDEFLETIADELTASQKETAVLKSKMKVLVDKIEEYRGNENAINQTLLSAQKLATQIEAEARQKSQEMIAEAEKKVADTLGEVESKVAVEEKILAEAKASSAKFISGVRAMCNAQLKNLDAISAGKDSAAAATAAADAVAAAAAEKKAASAPARAARQDFARQAADIEEAVRSIEQSVAGRQPEVRYNMDFDADLDTAKFYSSSGDKDSTQPFRI